MTTDPSSDVVERVQRFVATMENGGPQRVFYRDVDCPVSDFRELLATIERLSAERTECRRNVYRLQTGGDRLCDALRSISAGCDNPAKVARDALNHKAPDPDFAALSNTAENG